MKAAIEAFLLVALAAAAPAWSQGAKARPLEGLSAEQRADYDRLMRGYVDAFRILGRAKACGKPIDRVEPFLKEIARRHGEGSDLLAIAGRSFTAAAENHSPGPELERLSPAAPMPCDVIVYMKDLRLPEIPASLALP